MCNNFYNRRPHKDGTQIKPSEYPVSRMLPEAFQGRREQQQPSESTAYCCGPDSGTNGETTQKAHLAFYISKELTKFMVNSLGAPVPSGTRTVVFKFCLCGKNIFERFI